MKVAVIGGGAAGFFAAVSAKRNDPSSEVVLYEKSNKVLAKVRVSGGGRCNVTHACFNVKPLAANYPRGERFLRKSFQQFATRETIAWFEDLGVHLNTEKDGRMFPTTNDSETIVSCLIGEAERLGVHVRLGSGVSSIQTLPEGLELQNATGLLGRYTSVIVTTGGHPKPEGYDWLRGLGHTIIPPVPSLFTFNMPEEPIRELMGISANATVRLVGTDLRSTGPVLITHWGMSGPAILRLSAWGAREMSAMNYSFGIRLNWLDGRSEDLVREEFHRSEDTMKVKQVHNADPFKLPKRLWDHLTQKAGIQPEQVWGDLTKKAKNRLIDVLTNDSYSVKGKTTFKEEFVTAGGVSLEEVDPLTLASDRVKGLYFAGEVLDIDGITGGFNFQAAWTTGFLAGRAAVVQRLKDPS